jgi:PIN domain nuclease of toxin-antitoxin system
MRLLLDTHVFLWWVFQDLKLSRSASAWEIATKYRIGKLPDARVVAGDIRGAVAAEGFGELAISIRHAEQAGSLAGATTVILSIAC